MGQKVDPRGFRVGITRGWNSKWFASKKKFGEYLVEDQKIKRFVKKQCYFAQVSKIEIERNNEKVKVLIHAARPGIIIGKKGSEVEKLNTELEQRSGSRFNVDIKEVQKPELNAQIVSETVADQLSKRAYFRMVMKKAVDTCSQAGAMGVKVICSGRLGGSDMARRETVKQGSLPLQTLDADVDYGFTEAATTYGHIGVKVWIYRGSFIKEQSDAPDAEAR